MVIDYKDKIKVVSVRMMCFPIDPITLNATRVSYYDPYAWIHLEPGAKETISLDEWNRRCSEKYKRNAE